MSEQIKTIFHDKIHVSNQTDGSRPHRSAEKHFIAIYKFWIESVCKLLIYQYSIDKRNIGNIYCLKIYRVFLVPINRLHHVDVYLLPKILKIP